MFTAITLSNLSTREVQPESDQADEMMSTATILSSSDPDLRSRNVNSKISSPFGSSFPRDSLIAHGMEGPDYTSRALKGIRTFQLRFVDVFYLLQGLCGPCVYGRRRCEARNDSERGIGCHLQDAAQECTSPYDWLFQILNRSLRRSLFGSLLFLFLFTGWIRAVDADADWVQRYANVVPLVEVLPSKVIIDPWGDIIVSGIVDDRAHGKDLLTIKYSGSDGTRLWLHRYNGPANREEGFGGLAVDSNGDVVVGGSSKNIAGYFDMYLAKYGRTSGTAIWEKIFHPQAVNREDPLKVGDAAAMAVGVGNSGNLFVTGYAAGTNGYNDVYTASYSMADGSLLWQRRHAGDFPASLTGQAIAVDENGNVIVRGSSSVAAYDWRGFYASIVGYLAAYSSASGAILWESDYAHLIPSPGADLAYANGFGAYIFIYGNAASAVKFSNKDGRMLWSSTAGFTNGGPSVVAISPGGEVAVAGATLSPENDYKGWLAKLDSGTGATVWRYNYEDADHPRGFLNEIAFDFNGDVVVAGYFYSVTNSAFDLLVAKHASSDGTVRWKNYYDSSAHRDDIPFALTISSQGDPVVTGISNDESANNHGAGSLGNRRCLTLKFAGDGTGMIWEAFDLPGQSSVSGGTSVAVDREGNPIVTGYSYNERGNADFCTIKYNASTGAEFWNQRFDSNYGEKPAEIAVGLDGNAVVVGFSDFLTYTPYAVQYAAADGRMMWHSPLGGSELPGPLAIAIDLKGDILTSYLDDRSATHSTMDLLKYSPTNGVPFWGQALYPHQAPINPFSACVGLTVDSNNNVFAIGPATDNSGNQGFYLARSSTSTYAPAVWERTWFGPSDGLAKTCAVSVDSQGYVIVTRSIEIGRGAAESYTTKLSPSDGNTIWEARYASPAGGDDVPSALAVDRNGDIVVTGTSYGSNRNPDYCTVKYSSANGAPHWKALYNGPANGIDVATAVAIDPNNDVVVTGYSYNERGNADYYTICYSGETGSVVWEHRYDGPAGGDDKPEGSHSLAIGPGGAVFVTGTSQTSPFEANGTEYATVKYFGSPRIRQQTNELSMKFPSDPGRGYAIQRATSITGPWLSVTNLVAPMNDFVEFEDSMHANSSVFYRLVSR